LNHGFLTAIDPATQKEVWRADLMNGGGTLTTAGNLVFGASNDGELVALSADKGEKLWSAKLMPGFANPATYMVDGKQYVSVLSGRGGKARIYTFALDGNVPIPSRPAGVSDSPFGPPPPPAAAPAPQAPTMQNQQ
jgi:quinohemoprotein ethanol dehydrogenase